MGLGLSDGILFLIAGLLVAFTVFAVVRQYEKKRARAFHDAARHAGWSEAEDALPPEVEGFPLCQRGRSRQVTGCFRRRGSSHDALLFEYKYVVGSGKNSSTRRQTGVAYRFQGAPLPEFELRPENVFHRIGEKFGYQDIDLENRPEFSKAYLLRGPDEDAIRALFGSGSRVHHFEKSSGWTVEAAGEWVIAYRDRKRVKPDQLREFLREAERTASILVGR